MNPRIAVLLLAATAASPAAAQAPGMGEPFDQVEVTLVQLEVAVSDRRGEPVTGLGRDDFELLQEGEPVPLAGFTAFGGGGRTAAEHPLHLAIYLDPTYLEPGDLKGLPEALASFVAGLGPEVRVMLLSAGEGVLHGFSAPRDTLPEHLTRLTTEPRGSLLASEYAGLLGDIRRQERQGADPRFQGTAGAQPQLLLLRVGAFAERAYRDLETTTLRLRRLLDALAGLLGRRQMLYVGGRLPATAGSSLYTAWRTAFGRSSTYWMGAEGPEGATDDGPAVTGGVEFETLPEGSEFLDTSLLLDAVAEHAAAVGVSLHTLDTASLRPSGAGGVPAGGDASGASAGRRAADARTLRALAEATGGLSLDRGRDFEAALATFARDLEGHYLLAFAPPAGADGQQHEIRVRLSDQRGLRLRHPPSYRARSRDEETAARAVTALLLGTADNPLGVVVVPQGDEEGAAGALRLAVQVPLAGLALVADGRVHRGQLSVFTTSRPPGGEALPVRKAVVPVRLANDEILAAQGRTVEVVTELPSPGPGGRIAVTVRDDLQGLVATVTLTVGADGLLAFPASAVGA